MKRQEKLYKMWTRYGSSEVVNVHFMDGTCRKFALMDALLICITDQSVVDATVKDRAGTALLREIIDGEFNLLEHYDFGE